MPSPPASSKGESDIENTAELPAPPPAANPGSGDRRPSATDTWIAPPHAGARAAEAPATPGPAEARHGDRKSTRLNSSHVSISYAVFCLKKKTSTERSESRASYPTADFPTFSSLASA